MELSTQHPSSPSTDPVYISSTEEFGRAITSYSILVTLKNTTSFQRTSSNLSRNGQNILRWKRWINPPWSYVLFLVRAIRCRGPTRKICVDGQCDKVALFHQFFSRVKVSLECIYAQLLILPVDGNGRRYASNSDTPSRRYRRIGGTKRTWTNMNGGWSLRKGLGFISKSVVHQ